MLEQLRPVFVDLVKQYPMDKLVQLIRSIGKELVPETGDSGVDIELLLNELIHESGLQSQMDLTGQFQDDYVDALDLLHDRLSSSPLNGHEFVLDGIDMEPGKVYPTSIFGS